MAIISANQVTRMGMAGGIWQPQGSYANKVAAPPITLKKHEGFRRNVGKMMR